MAVNYNAKLTEINNNQTKDLNNVTTMYNNMINNSTKYYDELTGAIKDYGTEQAKNQQEQSDFAIEKVQQAKDWANQDYIKEQKGAYADYKKQSNNYGATAEANAGLMGSGYSESSQVQMYTSYQNRVSTARETFNRAVVDYDNQMTEIRLQNNSTLAEIKFNSLQQQLELAIEGMQYKNTLLQSQLTAQNDVKDRYYGQWKDVQSLLAQQRQLEETIRANKADEKLAKDQLAWQKKVASTSGSGSTSSSGKSTSKKSSSKISKSKTTTKKTSSSIKKTSSKSLTPREMANSLGLPAVVKIENLNKIAKSKGYTVTKKNGKYVYTK